MLYYGSRISENIALRKPEGYLICQNVPVARTGTQEYAPQEFGLQGDQMITVHREESEVFSPSTIASFEGMPVTNNHPGVDVDAENIRLYQRGHVQNVRRGEGDQRDLLLADLVITHADLIDAVQNGKREVSCGYQFDFQDIDGKVYQRAIRGNHVAIVDQGRAGPRVAIKDQKPDMGKERSTPMKDQKKPAGILGKMFKAFAHDAEPEELEAAGKELFGEKQNDESAPPAVEKPPVAAAAPAQAPSEVKDEDPMTVLTQAVTSLVAKVDALASKMEAGAKPVDEDPLAQLEKEVAGESSAAPEGNLIDPEKMAGDESPSTEEKKEDETKAAQDRAAGIKAAIDAMKPIIAKLPEKDRKSASDAMAKQLRSAYGLNAASTAKDNAYIAIKQSAGKSAKDAAPNAQDNRELGKTIMQSRNANMQQAKK